MTLSPLSARTLLAPLCMAVAAVYSLPAGAQPHPPSAAARAERPGVPELLLGILSYARWPNASPNQALRLCVTGRSPHVELFLQQGLSGLAQRPILVQRLGSDNADDLETQCDALYVGALDDASWQRLRARALGRPVLTVCERVVHCPTGGMVCLDTSDRSSTPFEVNLDAVARSSVRLNPQVLRLGLRPQQGRP